MSKEVAIAYLKELEKLFLEDDPVREALKMAIEVLKGNER